MAQPTLSEIQKKVIELTSKGAGANLVVDALIEEDADQHGEPILLVRVILKRQSVLRETLELTYVVYTGLRDFLDKRGDKRRPVISYVNQDELKSLTTSND